MIFGFIPTRMGPMIWAMIFLLSFVSGSQEYASRKAKTAVKAANPWAPSVENTFAGHGIFRPTAWAKAGTDSFWQVPAILLAWKPSIGEIAGTNSPKPGQGMMISGKGMMPLPAETWGAYLIARVPSGGDLPGVFDDRKFLQGRSIQWRVRSKESQVLPNSSGFISWLFHRLGAFRDQVINEIEQGIPAPESHLMMAVLLGAKSPAAREAAQPFSRLGLSHLFAVSGLHVGIIAGIILLPLGLFHLEPGWRLVPALLFLPFYILLTGAPGSVLRASAMTLLLLLAIPLGRRSYSLQLLGLLFWAGTIWQPGQVLDPGLRLSYLATGGIIAITGFISSAETGFWSGKWGKIGMGLVVSLAAQWFTLPQVASSFGFISGFSPLANLFTVPLFGLAVWALVIGLALENMIPFIAHSLLSWTWAIVRFLTGLLAQITPQVQGWNMAFPVPDLIDGILWLLATGIMLGLIKNWSLGRVKGKPTLLAISLIFAIILLQFQKNTFVNSKNEEIHVWQFDVGQGDCSLIVFPDRWCGIIDTAGVMGWGRSSNNTVLERKIRPWLQRQHITDIGAIVLSHGHLDHTAGTNSLISEYSVHAIFTGGRSHKSVPHGPRTPTTVNPEPGTILHRWKDWELSFIQPDTLLSSHLHENDKSLVVVLKKGSSVEMIWTGDMEQKEEEILLTTSLMPHKTVVLKAGHHGSNTSSSQPFLDALDPQLVLISCGVGNKYHHPSHGPYLSGGDTIPVLRTDLSGSIHLWWDSMGIIYYKTGKKEGFLPKP
jgi:competence protein ComEC